MDERLALPAHVAAGDLAGQLDQAEQRLGGDALARAALADQPERLAAVDVEGHAADGLDHAAPREEVDAQVLDVEQRRGQRVHVQRIVPDLAGVVEVTVRHSSAPPLLWKLEANFFSRSCGSSITRSQLLSRLTASTVRLSSRPG